MKKIIVENGGRPFLNDDLTAIQEQLNTLEKLLSGFSQAFVLQGCSLEIVSGNQTLKAGLVCIENKILEVEEQLVDLTTTKYIIIGTETLQSERTYQDGNSKFCISNTKAIVSNTPTSNCIVLPTTGISPKNIWQILESNSLKVGTILEVDTQAIANFDINGTGLGSGSWSGWAFCDGRNGTPDLRKLFIVGLDTAVGRPINTQYDTIGKTGGAEAVTLNLNQIPSHNHNQGDFNKLLLVDGNGTTGSINIEPNEPNLTVAGTLQSAGGGQSHENRPPFYVLARVKKIV